MTIIYIDILKNWTNCWRGAVIIGILLVVVGRWINYTQNQQKPSIMLFFADGVFLYYLLYVTLFSRVIGSRREVVFTPFASLVLINKEFHYVMENVLLFIPFGALLYMTLKAYGKKCNLKLILLLSLLTSASIELAQYIFSCGKSETDDVITNMSGAMIGYLFVKLKRRE